MKGIWKDILLLVIVLISCVIIAELVLEKVVQPYYGVPPGAFIADDVLDYRPKPNFSGFFINEESDDRLINFTINSDGFRDKEYTIMKPKDVKRIALLGDSVVMAEQVELNKTFSELLERDINYEVLNFGVSGYGTRQAFEFYKIVGEKYKPDIVIYFFTPNDLQDNLAKRYTIVAGERVSYSYKDDSEWLVRIKIYFYRNSALLRTFYRVIKSGGEINFKDIDLYEFYGGDESWNEMGKIIGEMKEYFKNKNVRFILVRNSDPLTVYFNKDFGEIKKFEEMDVEVWDPSNFFAIRSQPLFFKIDKHMNEFGHYHMARFLSNKINEK